MKLRFGTWSRAATSMHLADLLTKSIIDAPVVRPPIGRLRQNYPGYDNPAGTDTSVTARIFKDLINHKNPSPKSHPAHCVESGFAAKCGLSAGITGQFEKERLP